MVRKWIDSNVVIFIVASIGQRCYVRAAHKGNARIDPAGTGERAARAEIFSGPLLKVEYHAF